MYSLGRVSLERAGTAAAARASARAQIVEAGAGLGADRDHLGAGHELTRLGERQFQRLGVHGVGLGDRDHAPLDPEQPQDRKVLVRLRPCPLAGVDHEQEEVDPGRAGDHRAHEALVPGHVHERELRPVGQLERRVAERDRDPALPLLRQPVGVLARQRANEPGLAVVDVSGCPDRQRHPNRLSNSLLLLPLSPGTALRRRFNPPSNSLLLGTGGLDGRGGFVGLGVRERAAVEQQAAVADDSDHGRVAAAKRLGEGLLDRAGEARQLRERQARPRRRGRPSPRPRRRPPRPTARPVRGRPRAARSASAAPAPRAAPARARGRARASPRAPPV